MTSLILLIICTAYLIGSLSSAVLASKLFRFPDPRTAGSMNPGATNIYRLGGIWPSIIVLTFDLSKGFLPVYIGHQYDTPPFYLGIIAVSACLGHMYSLYFRFSGGKGVATAFGSLLAIDFLIGVVIIVFWIALVKQFKLVSLATLLSSIFGCFLYWYIAPHWLPTMATLTLLIILGHRANLARLITRQEPRINKR